MSVVGVSCKQSYVVQVPWNSPCKAGHLVHMFAKESAEEWPSEATPQSLSTTLQRHLAKLYSLWQQ